MTEASSEYFQQVAGSWDSLRSGYFGEAVRQAAIDKAYLRPEMVVADVGSGTGFMAAGLAPLVKRVYVVDGSAAMLDVARKNLSAFENIEFHEADGLSLPFPEESLDAVFANMYLHHCPDPLAAVQEIVRVLRPGGRLVITDMDAHPYTWLKEEMADVWQGFDRDRLRAWYKQAGLVNVVVDNTGQSCCAELNNMAIQDEKGRKANVRVFVATGTRRMAMREAVEENYSAIAKGGACGCSSPAEGSSNASNACCGGIASSATDTTASTASNACCGGGASSTNASRASTASTTSNACCGGAEASSSNYASDAESVNISPDYSQEELSAVPAEAAEIPLGCGNPVAIANLRPGEVVLDIGSGGGLNRSFPPGGWGLRAG